MAEVDYENYVIPEGDIMTPEELYEARADMPFPFPGTFVYNRGRRTSAFPNRNTGGQQLNNLKGRHYHSDKTLGSKGHPSEDLRNTYAEARLAKVYRIPLLSTNHVDLVFKPMNPREAPIPGENFYLDPKVTLKDIGELIAREQAFGTNENYHTAWGHKQCSTFTGVVIKPIKWSDCHGLNNSSRYRNRPTGWSASTGGSCFVLTPVRRGRRGPMRIFTHHLEFNEGERLHSMQYTRVCDSLQSSCGLYNLVSDIKACYLLQSVETALVQYALSGATLGSYLVGWEELSTRSFESVYDVQECFNPYEIQSVELTWTIENEIKPPFNSKSYHTHNGEW